MSDNIKQEVRVNVLVALIEKLNPFLDSSGNAYVVMPHSDEKKRIVRMLRSHDVCSYLCFHYKMEHNQYLKNACVPIAINFVEGRLFDNRRGQIVDVNCPILMCFLRFIEEVVDYCGSASDILKLLREVNSKNRLLKGKEKLTKSPTVIGKWITKNQLLLLARGVEVFRPPRCAMKRLWGFRRIIRDDDSSDASLLEVSQGMSLPNSGQGNENQLNYPLSEEETIILQRAQL
jgi:hypothetical protein